MMGIYAYVDTMDNSVVYVGKDSNIDKCVRRKDHMAPYKYDAQIINRVLQNNPNRYQYKEIFVFDEISQDELNHLEMQQIALFNPKFNYTKGGEGMLGYKHSIESKNKISEAKKGKNNFFYGKHLSDEHRRKLSEAHKGKTFSLKSRRKMSEAKNTVGYFRVSKDKNKDLRQGFRWKYQYYEEGKLKSITCVDFEKLEAKVKARGLEWYKLDEVLV